MLSKLFFLQGWIRAWITEGQAQKQAEVYLVWVPVWDGVSWQSTERAGQLGYALGSNPDCTPGLTRCLDAYRLRREALRDNVSFFNWVALYWRELGECPWVTEE